MKVLLAALSVFFLTTTTSTTRAEDKPDIYVLSGEVLGFYYALDEYSKGMCGPLDSGPYGAKSALAFLDRYLNDVEMKEMKGHIADNEAKDRAYFRGILADNFRKRMNSTIQGACDEFTTIYLNLLNESKQAVIDFRG